MDLIGAIWRKSTRSSGNSGNCVEVADYLPGVVGVRDSKDPTGARFRAGDLEGVRHLREGALTP